MKKNKVSEKEVLKRCGRIVDVLINHFGNKSNLSRLEFAEIVIMCSNYDQKRCKEENTQNGHNRIYKATRTIPKR